MRIFNLNKAGHELQNYFVVTLAYQGFTLTDGAIRMLVVLYFYQLGYSPLEITMLFLFYELCGVVTNFIGGWMASHMGLNTTMHLGMSLQVLALLMLAVPFCLVGFIKDEDQRPAYVGLRDLYL